MGSLKKWQKQLIWVTVSTVSGLLIGFGLIDYFKSQGWNPLYLAVIGIVGLAIAIKTKNVRTLTSIGNKRN